VASAAILYVVAVLSGLLPRTPFAEFTASLTLALLPVVGVPLAVGADPTRQSPQMAIRSAAALLVLSTVGILLTVAAWRILDTWSRVWTLPAFGLQFTVAGWVLVTALRQIRRPSA